MSSDNRIEEGENMVIEVKNATKKITGKVILDSITVNLESGKIYGVVGANGSGKTMFLRLLSGLMLPTEGNVLYNGKKLKKGCFPDSVGLLLENPAFLDQYTGLKNLQLLATIRQRVSEEEVKVILRKVGLDPEDRRKYGKYSLGMKQRLGIASALMEKPEIVLLDEPTNALDPNGVKMIEKLIVSERERGSLIVVASHDTTFIQEISDVIIGVENGKLFIR